MHEFGFMVLKPFYLALTLMRNRKKKRGEMTIFWHTDPSLRASELRH
jgi:hypothetical protein